MGGGVGGNFGNTNGNKINIKNKISSLPKNPNKLLNESWKETTHTDMSKNTSSRTFKDQTTGLNIGKIIII